VIGAARQPAQLEGAIGAGAQRSVRAFVLVGTDLDAGPGRGEARVHVDAAERVALRIHDLAPDRLAARVEEHEAVAQLALLDPQLDARARGPAA
jgi:hypothetical protein